MTRDPWRPQEMPDNILGRCTNPGHDHDGSHVQGLVQDVPINLKDMDMHGADTLITVMVPGHGGIQFLFWPVDLGDEEVH